MSFVGVLSYQIQRSGLASKFSITKEASCRVSNMRVIESFILLVMPLVRSIFSSNEIQRCAAFVMPSFPKMEVMFLMFSCRICTNGGKWCKISSNHQCVGMEFPAGERTRYLCSSSHAYQMPAMQGILLQVQTLPRRTLSLGVYRARLRTLRCSHVKSKESIRKSLAHFVEGSTSAFAIHLVSSA